jgi:hypothetical protein
VTLQLEGSRKLPVAVLAGGVVFPAVTFLFLKFQMVLYVIHKLHIFQNFQATEAFKGCVSFLFWLPISFILSIVEVTK